MLSAIFKDNFLIDLQQRHNGIINYSAAPWLLEEEVRKAKKEGKHLPAGWIERGDSQNSSKKQI